VGIQNVGKTTILYRMALNELVVTSPTIGANVEEIHHENVKFQAFDLGGQENMRSVWDAYYNGVDGILYVVDSSDQDNIEESRKEFHKLLCKEELQNSVILVFANKQDLEEALKIPDIIKKYEFDKIKDRVWHIQPCSAKSGEGLAEGLHWLSEQVISKKENKFTNNPYINNNKTAKKDEKTEKKDDNNIPNNSNINISNLHSVNTNNSNLFSKDNRSDLNDLESKIKI